MKILVSIIFVLIMAAAVAAQAGKFTYQGKLDDNNAPANGTYLLQFKLFDAANNQIGPTSPEISAQVTNGIFTVSLDFGPSAWTGPDRNLEIAIRKTVNDPFTTLTPRQFVSSAPYSIRSLSAQTADNATSAVNAANADQLGGISPGGFIQNAVVQQAAANFNISGNGTAAGTLSGNVVNAAVQFSLNGTRILHTTGTGNLFAGASAGASVTSGQRNSVFGTQAGLGIATGNDNAFFGNSAGRFSTGSDNSFFGSGAGGSNISGSSNSFFGKDAGAAGTSSSANSFFGWTAGKTNTGFGNSFFGAEAGPVNTSGFNNSFFGNASGLHNISGAGNAFFGYGAGFSSSTGDGNTFIGSGAANSTFGGSGNTVIGSESAFSMTNGDNNTSLGFLSNVGSNVSNATAIGFRSYAGLSNTMVLGSINGVNSSTVDTDVGVGTFKPNFRLHVKAPGQDGIKIQHNGTGDFPQIRFSDSNDVTKAVISVGPVGSEDLRFFVNGSDRLIVQNTGTVAVSTLGTAGSTQLCRNASNEIATCSSSLRYKTNIAAFTPGLSLVRELKPISFDWKQGGMHDVGFGAEDVAKLSEQLIVRNDRGEVEGVKYDRISTILVNAVKEQQQQIEALKREVSALKVSASLRRSPRNRLRRQVATRAGGETMSRIGSNPSAYATGRRAPATGRKK